MKMKSPRIIQGGMGVAVSSWQLARAVGQCGQMGVVSGTAIDLVIARRLQMGDIGGHIRQALDHFPLKEMAERVWNRYFIEGGKPEDVPFKSKPVPTLVPGMASLDLMIVGSFVEVWLAKFGHDGPIGINLLEKIQLPTIPTLYGAMMAGVDHVLMGAGIPRTLPAIIEKLSKGEPCELNIDVEGDEPAVNKFDPSVFGAPKLKRPKFWAIVSSASLATLLTKKCNPPADGFIIEGPTAGGHNAPPRGQTTFNEIGEPVYGERDKPDFAKFREIGLPFYLAGSYGTHEALQYALSEGAEGVQVGTAFAFCDESGLMPSLKRDILRRSVEHRVTIYTDARCSPTGFPFKVVQHDETMANSEIYKERPRICDLGYLRDLYKGPDGKYGYRCPSEPIEDYLKKGGNIEDTVGRKCVCNGLLATIGMPQIHKDGYKEIPLVTAGDEVAQVARFVRPGQTSYSAKDVIDEILGVNQLTETPVATQVAS